MYYAAAIFLIIFYLICYGVTIILIFFSKGPYNKLVEKG